MKMDNKKGFTLIELLAVITIMGILLVIAIPAVNFIITNSRKNVYIDDAKIYIQEGRKLVIDGQYQIDDPNTTYYINIKNLTDDYDTAKSPWAKWLNAYVAVTFKTGGDTKYYWVSSDQAGWQVKVTEENRLKKSDVFHSNEKTVNYRVPLDGTKKVVVIDENGVRQEVDPYLILSKEEAKECFSFKEKDSGVALTYYNVSCGSTVMIPSQVGDKKVTEIYQYTFNNMGIESVYIPDTVQTIESRAFAYNNLTAVHIPSSVKSIGTEAFRNNKISDLVMEEGITSTGVNAFRQNNLTEAVVPNSLTLLGACTYCDNPISNPSFLYLKKADGSYDYSTIRGYIGDLSEFKHNNVFVIPASVNGVSLKTIAANAFQRLSITNWEVVIPSTVTYIGSSAFYQSYISKVNLPDGLKTIGTSAFLGNRLTSLYIPGSVTSIGKKAFNSGSVQDPERSFIYARSTGPDGNAVIDYSNLIGYAGAVKTNLTIPTTMKGVTLKTIGDSAFMEVGLRGTLIVPNTVTKINNLSFGRNYLDHIDNGDGRLEGPFAYKRNSDGSVDRTNLISYGGNGKDIVVPDGVTNINYATFYYAYGKSLVLPESLKTIGNQAFEGNQFKEVVIPKSVTSIGANAFKKEVTWGRFNADLTKIVNKTGKAFKWGAITGGPDTTTSSISGPVENWYGDLDIVEG